MRRRILLLLVWLLGILFPLAWLGRFSPAYRRAFNAFFAPPWMHILMHAALFAGLVILTAHTFRLPPTRKTALLLLGVVLAVGLLQEAFQLFSRGLKPGWGEVYDLGVDLVGGVMGMGIWMLFARRLQNEDNDIQANS